MTGAMNLTMPSFTAGGDDLDEAGVRHDVRQAKAHGFFATLCTAEAGLSLPEAERFVEVVADEAGEELVVATTAMFDSLDDNYRMLEHAAETGLDLVFLGYPPAWVPDDAAAVRETTRDLCAAADVGVILHLSDKYNFESLHPSGYPMGILDDLADIDNAVAMEVSDPGLVPEADRICGDRLLLTNPIEGHLPKHVTAYDVQWFGAGPYEVYQTPEQPLLVEYLDDLLAGEWDAAMETFHRLTPIRQVFTQQMRVPLQVGTYHWPQMKFYQWLTGGNGGYTRQPVMQLTAEDREAVRGAMRRVGLDPRGREDDDAFFLGRAATARAD
jgi:4-hydroxy-tetrahydrodipicolinate synthase